MTKINFLTSDGVKIVGNWFPSATGAPSVLLLHMRPATKESWNDFAIKLSAAGFSVLAIDLRGHGESTEQNGKKIDYRNFPDENHAACRLDIDAALDWLKKQDVSEIYVVGASIGANLSIDTMARRAEIKKGIALSPGLEYLGVTTDDAIKNIKNILLLVASKDDEYSYDSVKKLHKINPSTNIKLYETAGHANHMFEKYPELMDELIRWLK